MKIGFNPVVSNDNIARGAVSNNKAVDKRNVAYAKLPLGAASYGANISFGKTTTPVDKQEFREWEELARNPEKFEEELSKKEPEERFDVLKLEWPYRDMGSIAFELVRHGYKGQEAYINLTRDLKPEQKAELAALKDRNGYYWVGRALGYCAHHYNKALEGVPLDTRAKAQFPNLDDEQITALHNLIVRFNNTTPDEFEVTEEDRKRTPAFVIAKKKSERNNWVQETLEEEFPNLEPLEIARMHIFADLNNPNYDLNY